VTDDSREIVDDGLGDLRVLLWLGVQAGSAHRSGSEPLEANGVGQPWLAAGLLCASRGLLGSRLAVIAAILTFTQTPPRLDPK